jgi:pimeloyl-ACP methyl ester carboxylesterase
LISTFTPSHRGGSGSPLVLLHGLRDTWRSWELIRPPLERRHDVLALTLAGHAGGPAIEAEITEAVLADAIQSAMDEEGLATAQAIPTGSRRCRPSRALQRLPSRSRAL